MDNFNTTKWYRNQYIQRINESEGTGSFAAAEDELYKRVTGEEPKASSGNKFRDVKESKLDTSTYIEPKEMEEVLEKIYHIISGNRRDYLNIGDDVVKCLKQFDKTKYNG